MTESTTISGDTPASKSMDYAFLRKEATRYVQKIAGKVWTDHNIHDPGITILESLCYAITELGYRTNHPIQDILYDQPVEGDPLPWKQFFTAAEILPNGPLTLIDYRKLVIDLEPVRNCWIVKSRETEIDLFLDDNVGLNYEGGEPLMLKGLFDVLIEFDDDQLNNFEFDISLTDEKGDNHSAVILLPHWDKLLEKWPKYGLPTDILIDQISCNEHINEEGRLDSFSITLSIKFRQPFKETINKGHWLRVIEEKMKGDFGKSLFREYDIRLRRAFINIQQVKSLLIANRNLCEDFRHFRGTRIQHIAVSATIQTKNLFNREEVLAEIYEQLDQYLTPRINFYSLEALLEKGRTPDEIFDGPLLENGFVDTRELESFTDREIIYTSDLVRIIMGVPQVVGVSDIKVANWVNYRPVREAENCLKLNTEIYKPKLSIEFSEISFTPDQPVDNIKLQTLLDERRKKSEVNLADTDIPIPQGEDLSIDEYYSIQHDFPQVYGIGDEGLNSSVSEERKAQALQLKGYLLCFEQLLANFLSQLFKVKNLMSMSPEVSSTYFYQPLYQVPNSSLLLNPENEDWESFISNHNNRYESHLQSITEDKAMFIDRRNR
ncbi:MAG: hypothetical protein IH946_13055, partial [Bacteroidetes bacterium]|nr:hypothetical protein [Bacteroidota bacterium]